LRVEKVVRIEYGHIKLECLVVNWGSYISEFGARETDLSYRYISYAISMFLGTSFFLRAWSSHLLREIIWRSSHASRML
jgi:hypothetical protein